MKTKAHASKKTADKPVKGTKMKPVAVKISKKQMLAASKQVTSSPKKPAVKKSPHKAITMPRYVNRTQSPTKLEMDRNLKEVAAPESPPSTPIKRRLTRPVRSYTPLKNPTHDAKRKRGDRRRKRPEAETSEHSTNQEEAMNDILNSSKTTKRKPRSPKKGQKTKANENVSAAIKKAKVEIIATDVLENSTKIAEPKHRRPRKRPEVKTNEQSTKQEEALNDILNSSKTTKRKPSSPKKGQEAKAIENVSAAIKKAKVEIIATNVLENLTKTAGRKQGSPRKRPEAETNKQSTKQKKATSPKTQTKKKAVEGTKMEKSPSPKKQVNNTSPKKKKTPVTKSPPNAAHGIGSPKTDKKKPSPTLKTKPGKKVSMPGASPKSRTLFPRTPIAKSTLKSQKANEVQSAKKSPVANKQTSRSPAKQPSTPAADQQQSQKMSPADRQPAGASPAQKKKKAAPLDPKSSMAISKKRTRKPTKAKINLAGLIGPKKKQSPTENGESKQTNQLRESSVTSDVFPKLLARRSIDANRSKVKLMKRLSDVLHESASVSSGLPSPQLRDRSMGILQSARFRFINQELYSRNSSEAMQLFKTDRNSFSAYHEGYRQQVAKWPTNPLTDIIAAIRNIPANHVVADFGCGDAVLAKSVSQKVHSFDLVSSRPGVIECDMSHVPLGDHSIDVAVFCLSLMGTNLGDYILEANRVLKVGAVMKIAEVASRFMDVKAFTTNVERYGFKLKMQNFNNKMFYMLDFRKERDVKNKKNLPTLNLEPCLYKKR